MKKETLLTWAVIGLLLLNFGTLGYLFFRRPPHPPGSQSAHQLGLRIAETLHFTPEQQQEFDKRKRAHHEHILQLDKNYADALGDYFALLKNDSLVSAQHDSLLTVLSNIQKERATITFLHFNDLKSMCTPEQRQHFDTLVPELMQVILPPKNRRGARQH